MKQGDKVLVSDESVECAIKGRTYRIYLCEYGDGHCCLARYGDVVAYFWQYAVPVPELPEGYTQWAGGECPVDGEMVGEVECN